MSRFWSPIVHQLTPYVPGEQPKHQQLIKLNTNESPYPPSPQVMATIRDYDHTRLRLYPDPESLQLRQAIADYYDLAPAQVFVGNGSDEVLAHAFRALLQQDQPLLFPDISYSFYPVYCQLFDIQYQTQALDEHLAIDLARYPSENGGIIFPNPNAPTGQLTSLQSLRQLLARNQHSVVVVDEAYIDFGGESAASLVKEYPQLLVIQTFSKSRALAGLRVGFALGDAALIEGLLRVKNSFNSYPLDQLAQQAAISALEDEDYFQQRCQAVMHSRQWLMQALEALGFHSLPSAANFIFTQHRQRTAADLAQQLRQQHIIVRHFKQPQRISNYLRISIGTEQECRQLLSALASILGTR